MLLSQPSSSHPINMVRHAALEAWQRVIESLVLPYMVERSSFPCSVQLIDVVDSKFTDSVKPGNYSMVIGYLVGEFACTWLAECYVTQSHIYPWFMDKVSTLTHLVQGIRINLFLDQAVADFVDGLHSVFNYIKNLELDESFDECDTKPSSVSSGFLRSVPFPILLN